MLRLVFSAALAVGAAVAVGACSDNATPKSTEAFCSRLSDLREGNAISDAATDGQAADRVAGILDDLIKTAPQQIKDDLRTFRRLIDDIRNVNATDAASAEAAAQKLATTDVISAGQSLSAFAQDQCGFSDVFQTGS